MWKTLNMLTPVCLRLFLWHILNVCLWNALSRGPWENDCVFLSEREGWVCVSWHVIVLAFLQLTLFLFVFPVTSSEASFHLDRLRYRKPRLCESQWVCGPFFYCHTYSCAHEMVHWVCAASVVICRYCGWVASHRLNSGKTGNLWCMFSLPACVWFCMKSTSYCNLTLWKYLIAYFIFDLNT